MVISYDINQLKTNININPVSDPMNKPKIYLRSQNYISDAAFLEEVPLTRSLSSNPSLPGCSGSAVSLPLGDWGKATMTQFTKAPLLLIWKLPHPSSSPSHKPLIRTAAGEERCCFLTAKKVHSLPSILSWPFESLSGTSAGAV